MGVATECSKLKTKDIFLFENQKSNPIFKI